MNKEETLIKLNLIDRFMWDTAPAANCRDWDEYSEELLEHCSTWDGLDSDTLWIAYNHGVAIVSSIDPNYAEQNL